MISATIISKNEQLVIKHAQGLESRILQALETGLANGLLMVVGMAQREYLSGPRPTKIQSITGNLRQRVTSSVTRAGAALLGRVGNSAKYAAYHEFGFHGTVNVRGHSRVTEQFSGELDEETDTRRAVRNNKGELLGYKESRKASTKFQKTGHVAVQFVKAHSRRVNYAGKPYVRPALERLTPKITEEIKKNLDLIK